MQSRQSLRKALQPHSLHLATFLLPQTPLFKLSSSERGVGQGFWESVLPCHPQTDACTGALWRPCERVCALLGSVQTASCTAWSVELALGRELCFTPPQMKRIGKPSGKTEFLKGGVWIWKEQSTGTGTIQQYFVLLYHLWGLIAQAQCRHSKETALTQDLQVVQTILQKHKLGIWALAFEVLELLPFRSHK